MQTQRNIGRSIVLVLAVWLAACAQPGSGLIAQIDSGKLQGTVIDDVTVFARRKPTVRFVPSRNRHCCGFSSAKSAKTV